MFYIINKIIEISNAITEMAQLNNTLKGVTYGQIRHALHKGYHLKTPEADNEDTSDDADSDSQLEPPKKKQKSTKDDIQTTSPKLQLQKKLVEATKYHSEEDSEEESEEEKVVPVQPKQKATLRIVKKSVKEAEERESVKDTK